MQQTEDDYSSLQPSSTTDQNHTFKWLLVNDQCYNVQNLELCDDIVFSVIQFLQSEFILRSCMRVCKQWLKISLSKPLSLRITNLQKLQHAAKCAQLKNLTILVLNGFSKGQDVAYGDAAIKIIAKSPHMKSLTRLEMENMDISHEGCLALANSQHVQNLTHLNWSINPKITVESFLALASSSNMKNLTSLDVFLTYVGDEGMKSIANMKHLRSLKFGSNNISLKGIKHVSSMSSLTELNVLHLDMNVVSTHQFLDVIANSESMCHLTKMSLYKSSISSQQVLSLTTSPYITQLTSLDLSGNNIGDVGIKSIATSRSMQHLKRLTINTCMISDAGACTIAKSSFMKNLTYLNVSNEDGPSRLSELNTISNAFAHALAESEFMQQLEELCMLDISVNDEGAIALAQSKYLNKLKCLHLSEIGHEAASLVVSKFPKVKFMNLPRCSFDDCLVM
ncbi:hypothetical protein C9374_010715 [Naegleria lovaniensis]|uniref:F-box domain-containing protein n=1 Tax=Naegleria lovaniensis TaxID=51637 RepID=A0AA88GHW3_NAELO|nr:uncharacterized protein C9374_010715 [Naegleria lovaniensis]KAG2374431.1 hypothetical protein C9374_010715 [Naegleria lovaniensis]